MFYYAGFGGGFSSVSLLLVEGLNWHGPFGEAAGRRVPDKLQVLFPNAQKLEEAYQQQDATNAEYRQLDRLSNCISSWHGS